MDRPWSPIYFGSAGPGNPTELTAVHIGRAFGIFAVNCKFRWINRGGRWAAMVLDGRAAALWGGRYRLAGFHGCGAGRRPIPRARAGRARAHPRQASIPQAAHGSGRKLSGAERSVRGREAQLGVRIVGPHGRIGGVICESMLSRQAIIFHSCVHRLVAHRRCARTRHHAPSARGHGQS